MSRKNRKMTTMGRSALAAAIVFVAGLAFESTTASAQQQEPLPFNSKIRTRYDPTKKFPELKARMENRQILQQYNRFLSPINLKRMLWIIMKDCGKVNSFYGGGIISICYEWLDMVINEAAKPRDQLPPEMARLPGTGLQPGFTPGEVIVGGIADVLLHETGHAVFDIQKVPRLGHEEDAADGIAAFVSLQFGKSLALTMVKGAINVNIHLNSKRAFNPALMSDGHSLDIQRAFNLLCMGYGYDKPTFEELATKWLPPKRKDYCETEYRQAKFAFDTTIKPDINDALLQRVLDSEILQPGDLGESLQDPQRR